MLPAHAARINFSFATFTACLEPVFLPVLRQRTPDAVLIMDNLHAHKTPEVQAVAQTSRRSSLAGPR
jgi:hypothetical protein